MTEVELVIAWLDSQLDPAYDGNIAEKWREFLIQQSYDFKTIPETLYEYLGDEAYTGTLPERYKQWLAAVIYA